MRKLLTLCLLLLFTAANAQETKCADVKYIEIYRFNPESSTFTLLSDRELSTLTFCMNEDEMMINNAINTHALFKKKTADYFDPKINASVIEYDAVDKYSGHPYTVIFIFGSVTENSKGDRFVVTVHNRYTHAFVHYTLDI